MRTEADNLALRPPSPAIAADKPSDASFRQKELTSYFRAAHALRHGPTAEDAAEDLVTIAVCTEWPLLRARCHGIFK